MGLLELTVNERPLVSIIVPTFNSEKYLEKCLKSLREQSYSNIEVIIVDNHSKDKTRQIAEKYGNLFLLQGPERSAQVNLGVRYARGNYVYEVGSDFFVESNVVEEAVKECEVNKFDAICIHNTSDASVSIWAKVRKMERDCYRDDELNISARFVKKNVYEILGGLDENLVAAEDYDFHNRLIREGFKIGRIRAQEIHLGEPKTLNEIVRKHFYYGKTLRAFLKKNRTKGVKQLSPIRPAFIKHSREFCMYPTLLPDFIIYQIIRYLSGGLGFLLGSVI